MKYVKCLVPKWKENKISMHIVVDHQGNPRSFVYNHSLFTEFQCPHPGDSLYTLDYYLEDEKFVERTEFFQSRTNLVPSSHPAKISPMWRELFDNLCDPRTVLFPQAHTYQPTLKVKKMRVLVRHRNFLKDLQKIDEEMYDFILEQIEKNPNTVKLDTDWKLAKPFNTNYNIRSRLTVDNSNDTIGHLSDHWLFYHKDGTITWDEGEPTAGCVINGITGRTVTVHNNPPLEVPPTVSKAIRITLGDSIDSKTKLPTGVSWTMFTTASK